MPPGGEGMPGPFPQGGAEQAPPTPDGMPPQQFAIGGVASAMGNAFMTQAGRFAPAVARTLNQAGPAASRYAQSANAALGRMFLNPNVTQPMLGQARGPGGRFVSGGPGQVRGAGGKFTAEQIARGGDLMYPTLTQGLNQGLNQLAAQYPKAGPVLSSAAAMLAGLDGGPEAEPDRTGRQAIGYEVPMMAPASGAGGGRGFIDERYYENVPGMSRGEATAAAEAAAAEAAAAPAEEQSGFDLPPAGNDENEALIMGRAVVLLKT